MCVFRAPPVGLESAYAHLDLPGSNRVSGDVLNAVVLHRMDLAGNLRILRVAPAEWVLPEFIPGQFAVLGLPGSAPRCLISELEDAPTEPDKLIRRAYSVASSSRMLEYLEFLVVLVRSGALTPRLFHLQPGDRLWLGRKIVGMFTLDSVPADRNLLLFATGTGLAPYMSMIRTFAGRHRERRIAIVHGARHSADLAYSTELRMMEQLCPTFHYFPIISRAAEEPVRWAGRTGYVQDVWTSGALEQCWGARPTPADTHVYLCGNIPMIEDMISLLGREGFREHTRKTPGELHVERYW